MSFFHGASGVVVHGTQVAAAPGSTVTINQGSQAGVSSALKDLSAAAAHTAVHNSAARFDAPRCHRNTRAKYRNWLELWMTGEVGELYGKQLIWLYGGAGAGKSAIMQSVVEQCAQLGAILGTFFFARAESTRNYAEVLIPTLAYQVACTFPEAMVVFDPIIQRNPLIFKASVDIQAYELLVRPILYLIEKSIIDNTSPIRRVFVIDGLDECSEPQKQALIIRVVASVLCDHRVPICFMIASRPEVAICSAFEKEKLLYPMLTSISLDDDEDARNDIRQFIEDSFLDILDSHPLRHYIDLPWPGPHSVDRLVEKSSGHFIYGATAMKFITSSDEHPSWALRVVEGLEPSRTISPFAELDALYTHILTSAKYAKEVLEILRHCYFSEFGSSSVDIICHIHNISPEDVSLFLLDVQSLVSLAPSFYGELWVQPKHASIGDFLKDQTRSQMLHIAYTDYYASFLARYFQLLDNRSQRPTHPFYLMGSNVKPLVDSLIRALRCSQDTDLLHSLIACHTPHDIWNFCMKSMMSSSEPEDHRQARRIATDSILRYVDVIPNSIYFRDNALYCHQIQIYVKLVLDDIGNDFVHKRPQNRIIPALVFSSIQSELEITKLLLCHWNREFRIDLHYLGHFLLMRTSIDSGAIKTETLRHFQISQSSDLANAMKLVLQQLVNLSWFGPSKLLHTSPHKQWLRQHKGLKQISIGSPRLSSVAAKTYFTIVTRDNQNGNEASSRYHGERFLLSCWHRLQIDKVEDTFEIHLQKRKSLLLLWAVVFHLKKSDCTSEVATLARRSLPMVAQWYPKLMKKARAEMDAYVCRWEDSVDSLLEMTKSMHINDTD